MPRLTKYGVQDKRAGSSANNAQKARDALISYIKKGKEMINEDDKSENDQEQLIPEDTEVEPESDEVYELEPEDEPEDESEDEPEDEPEDESEESEESELESDEEDPIEIIPVKPKRKSKSARLAEEMAEMKAMMHQLVQPRQAPPVTTAQPTNLYYDRNRARQEAMQAKLDDSFMSQFNK